MKNKTKTETMETEKQIPKYVWRRLTNTKRIPKNYCKEKNQQKKFILFIFTLYKMETKTLIFGKVGFYKNAFHKQKCFIGIYKK